MTATATGTYATKDELKRRLGITDTNDDTELQLICDWANAGVESVTHRILAPITLTNVLYDGYDAMANGRCLLLPLGIRSVTSLDIATTTGGTFTACPTGDLFIRPTTQERDPGWPGTELWMTDIPSSTNTVPFFPPGYANIRLTGAGGFAAQPDDVIDVALNAAVTRWRNRSASGGQIGSAGERFVNVLSGDDRATLSLYTRREVAVI